MPAVFVQTSFTREAPMDSATWQRLEHLFSEAVELPESQRTDFCDRCADDPRLREELRSLLKAHEDTRC